MLLFLRLERDWLIFSSIIDQLVFNCYEYGNSFSTPTMLYSTARLKARHIASREQELCTFRWVKSCLTTWASDHFNFQDFSAVANIYVEGLLKLLNIHFHYNSDNFLLVKLFLKIASLCALKLYFSPRIKFPWKMTFSILLLWSVVEVGRYYFFTVG